MTQITLTDVHYWDMYFVLQLLPTPGEWVVVDVAKTTRGYYVMVTMKGYGHILTKHEGGLLSEIAATKQGVNFYNYLVRIGFGQIQTEEEGKQIIAQLENKYIKLN